MTRHVRFCVAFSVTIMFSVTLGTAGLAAAQGHLTYTFTDLGSLGGVSLSPEAINDYGQVVGGGEAANGEFHAFLFADGVLNDLGSFGFSGAHATGINDLGQIVGAVATSGDRGVLGFAFLLDNGAFHNLGLMNSNGIYSAATGINDNGQIIGYEVNNKNNVIGFLFRDGFTSIQFNDIIDVDLWGINKKGQVVGTAIGETASSAFIWNKGRVQMLGALAGGSYSYGYAINNHGDVVGISTVASGSAHAFLYHKGVMHDLLGRSSGAFAINGKGQVVGFVNVPGGAHLSLWDKDYGAVDLHPEAFLYSVGLGINEKGQIIGQGGTSDGKLHGFLLTPDHKGEIHGTAVR